MLRYTGYFAILLLILVFALTFKISIYVELSQYKKRLRKEEERVKISSALIKHSMWYKENFGKLGKTPAILKYLSQPETLVNSGRVFEIEELKIVPLNETPADFNGFDSRKFIEELISAPEKIKKEVFALSEVLGKVYRLKHPIKYKLNSIKKNIRLRILGFILEIYIKRAKKSSNVKIKPAKNRFEAKQNAYAYACAISN